MFALVLVAGGFCWFAGDVIWGEDVRDAKDEAGGIFVEAKTQRTRNGYREKNQRAILGALGKVSRRGRRDRKRQATEGGSKGVRSCPDERGQGVKKKPTERGL